MLPSVGDTVSDARRSPCGERGLKLCKAHACAVLPGRSPCGERGLKSVSPAQSTRWNSRSPCGERGLKSCARQSVHHRQGSLPVRGAWIEIRGRRSTSGSAPRSLPVRGAWIEIFIIRIASKNRFGRSPCGERGLKSAPSPQAWLTTAVAPRAGSVD